MVNADVIDFTSCPIDVTAQYGGSDKKCGIFYNDKHYMLKFADRVCTDNRNEWNGSYSNSVYSEKVCCDILKELGFSVQDTLLGYIQFADEKKPVVACENFVPTGTTLLSFKTIANATLSTKLGKLPKVSEIYSVLSKPSAYFDDKTRVGALRSYWDLFILDAFLGNFDRHADNWSYLYNVQSHSMHIAPIYACGSCLYPQVDDSKIPAILASTADIVKRVDTFPNAALLTDDGHKINYKKFIASNTNLDCTEALLRIFPRINMATVFQVIDEEPLTDIRKQFYKTMLVARYSRILVPAHDMLRR